MINSKIITLDVFVKILLLSQKYDFTRLYIASRHKLFDSIPATLDDYDRREESIQFQEIDIQDDFAELVHLARTTDSEFDSILPWTFLMCCRYFPEANIACSLAEGICSNARLSHQDQITCLAGASEIRTVMNNTTYAWLSDTDLPLSNSCITAKQCLPALKNIRLKLYPLASNIMGFERWSMEFSDGLCDLCTQVAQSQHNAGRRALWDRLPGLFNLLPWDNLLEARHDDWK